VVKVERPGDGDQSRTMPAGTSANFHFLNRNKRSITIDLKGSRTVAPSSGGWSRRPTS